MNMFRMVCLILGLIFGFGFVESGSWLAFVIACAAIATAFVPPEWLD